MTTHLDECVPEGLEVLYERDLGPAPYTVDDVVAGGRRRVRRARVTLGSAAAAAAIVLGVSLGWPLGPDRGAAPPADTSPTATATPTSIAPAPTATSEPRADSGGCSSQASRCDGDVLSSWVLQTMEAEVTVGEHVLLDREGSGAEPIGHAHTAVFGSAPNETTVSISRGTGVALLGGLYGDASLPPGKVRTVALPSGGRAEVRTWSREGGHYRSLWLTPAHGRFGELRVLLKHGLAPDDEGREPAQTVEALDDAAVVDLIESFR